MTIYEYDFVTLELSEEQTNMTQMGMGNIEQLNIMIRDAINQYTDDGWEPLYPFMVPQIWLRRAKPTKRKKKTIKKS